MDKNNLDNKTKEGKPLDNKTGECEFIKNCNDAMNNDDCRKYFTNCAKYDVWKRQGGC